MKNKKMVFGTILLLFALTGICNVLNVFAIEDPDYTVTIDAGEIFTVGANLNFGEIVRIEYEITETEADLHFYIKNSNDETIENLGHVVGYGLYHFYVPYDDYFRINFRNDCIFAHRHLKLNLDIIVQKTITITSPSSANTFTQGYNNIYWTSTGTISYVAIDLYKDGYFLERISSTAYNDGSYSWYIYTDEYIDSSYYQIRISDYNDNTIYDYSSYFTIECESETKTIIITSPISTDTLLPGSNYITWTSTGDIDYVCIDLYKGGSFLETINSYTSNDGSYGWNIYDDEYEYGYYQIRISDYYDNTIYDYSSSFIIDYEPTTEPEDYSNNSLEWLFFIMIPVITVVIVTGIIIGIVLNKKHKKNILKEVPISPIKLHCTNCNTEILDKTEMFCTNCGAKIIK